MSCYDGFPPLPGDDEWEESEGDMDFLPDGDAWHEDWPGESQAGPEYWLYLNDAQGDDDEKEG